jgi:hypothetical protein
LQAIFSSELIRNAKRPILWLMLLAPYLLCWRYVSTYGVNTPLSDDFTFILALKLLRLKMMGMIGLLASQHNEHRCGLPYLLMLRLAEFTNYNTVFNMYMGLVFVGGSLAVAIYFLWPKLKKAEISPFALVPIAWLICSLRQTQNLLMAFQGAFESAFFLLLCLFLLDGVTRLSPRFWGAALCAVLSAFSFGNGLLTIPIGFLLIACKNCLEGKEVFLKRMVLLFAWTLVSALILFAYFWNFFAAVGQGKITSEFLLRSPEKVLGFVLGFMATPVAHEAQSAMFMGVVFFILCLICLIALIRKPTTLNADMVLPAMLVCYAVLSGCMAAYGRAQMGIEASFVSRYATMANYGWIGLYLLLLLGRNLGRDLRLALLSTTFACFTIGAIMTAMSCRLDGLLYRDIELRVENVIRNYRLVGPENLSEWTGVKAEDVVPLIEFMEENRLSLFARPSTGCDQVLQSTATSPYYVGIDYVNGRLISGQKGVPTIDLDLAKNTDIALTGWAADVQNHTLPKTVCALIDGKVLIPAAYGLTRFDFVKSAETDYLLSCGFSAACRAALLSKGSHDLSVKIVSRDGRVCFHTPVLLHLKVE